MSARDIDPVGLTIRLADSDADLEAWRDVRRGVLPDERTATVAEMRAQSAADPTRLLVVAELDGVLAASGLAGRSSLGCAGLHPRVLPTARRRGVGSAVLARLEAHAVETGFTEAVAFADDDGALAFALSRGYEEVDRQVEQVRTLDGTEKPAPFPAGVEVVTVAERPELLGAAYPLAVEGYAGMATFRPVHVPLEEWLRTEATLPAGSFVALAGDEVVGYAGLCRDDDDGTRAEDGLTAVRHDWRRRGLATALKRAELAWAAAHGIRLVYTWTQRGNDGMRAVNEQLGYVTRNVSHTMLKELGA